MKFGRGNDRPWFWVAIAVLSVIGIQYHHGTPLPPSSSTAPATLPNTQRHPPEVVLTQAALAMLIKKAADQQYLQDVFTRGPSLPLPLPKQRSVRLLHQTRPSRLKSAIQPPMPASVHPATILDPQQCNWDGQRYSIGEIVRSDQGWVRCTPSVVSPSEGRSHYGNAVWTLCDHLLK